MKKIWELEGGKMEEGGWELRFNQAQLSVYNITSKRA